MNTYTIDERGRAHDQHSGTVIATFDDNGRIHSPSGQLIGFVGGDGVVSTARSQRLGRVDADGTVYDGSNQRIGQVDAPYVHRQGALMLLL